MNSPTSHHKRIVTLAVVLAIIIGCGGKQSSETVVTFNCAANAIEIASLEKEIPQFARESGITIKLNPFSGDEKLLAMMAAGQSPDIFYTNAVVRDKLAAEGKLLDLRTVARGDSFVQRLYPYTIAQGTSIDSGWYSMSNWVFTCGVYFNKKLFDEAHLRYPDSLWTWDDMVSAARALTLDADRDGKAEQYGIYIGSHFIEAFEAMNHAPIGRDELFVSLPQESQEVYRRYLALMDQGIMPEPRRVQAMGMHAHQLLQNGKVAMLVESVPNTNLFESLKIPWAVAPLPRFSGREPRYFRSASGGYSISAATKNKDAAWRALKWIVGSASIYQPSPVFRDIDFAGGWEKKLPMLAQSGFRHVWESSERFNGGDLRFFVRFSSWTMTPILERLQPLLDQLWSRQITVDELAARIPSINADVRRDLDALLESASLPPAFRARLIAQRGKQ